MDKFFAGLVMLCLYLALITIGVGTSLAVWHAADTVSHAIEGGCAAAQLIGAFQ